MKEKLIQYCDLKKEIENLEKRIDKIRQQSDLIADVVQNGIKGHMLIRGIDYTRIHKLNKLEAVLQERYNKLLDMQTEIEGWINTIDRSDIRQIIEYRYIDSMTWIQIGHTMKTTADAVRVAHDRFLEKIT